MQAGTSKRVQEVFSPTEERLGEASTANDENVAGEVEGSVGQRADSIASSRMSIREKKLRRATKKVINANRLSRREVDQDLVCIFGFDQLAVKAPYIRKGRLA